MRKLLLLIFLHILLLYKLRYIAWPENLLWPYLDINGLTLYRDVFYIYPPVYHLILSSWDKIFGLGLIPLMTLTYLNIIITDVLLWLISKKRLLPLMLFIPLQIFFEGNGFWPDQLLAPIFLGCLLAWKNNRFILLGMLLTLAILTKQTAIYFSFGLILFAWKQAPKILIGGSIIAFFLFLYFLANQNFTDFWQQNIIYILSYHAGNKLQVQWPNLQQTILVLLIFIPAIIGGIWTRKYKVVGLMLLAAGGIFTRFEYFHLQPALPLAAFLISQIPLLLIIYLVFLVYFMKFYILNFNQPSRFLTHDFTKNAKIINTYVSYGSQTLFLNSWDHYYYLTGTVPVGNFFYSSTPWNWNYGNLQQKTIDIISREKPKYIFLGDCFKIKDTCFRPEIINKYVLKNYHQISKLPDGTGVFEYNPVSP